MKDGIVFLGKNSNSNTNNKHSLQELQEIHYPLSNEQGTPNGTWNDNCSRKGSCMSVSERLHVLREHQLQVITLNPSC